MAPSAIQFAIVLHALVDKIVDRDLLLMVADSAAATGGAPTAPAAGPVAAPPSPSIDIPSLKQASFSDQNEITEEWLKAHLPILLELLNAAIYEDWSLSVLEQRLKEKKELSAADQDAFVRYWKAQKIPIHQRLVERSNWSNNGLQKMSWRIDSRTRTRTSAAAAEASNELTAIIDFNIAPSNSGSSAGTAAAPTELVRIEIDRKQLQGILREVNSIQQQLGKFH